MKTILCHLSAAVLGLVSLPLYAAGHPDTTGWKDLFTLDLSNSVSPGKQSLKDGVHVAGDQETLWTKDSCSDFVLDLEFKVEKESNSGVFFRSSDIRNVLKALEMQVHESKDGYGTVGAIYDACQPSESMAKPTGEWNHFTITCKGSLVTLVFNGLRRWILEALRAPPEASVMGAFTSTAD